MKMHHSRLSKQKLSLCIYFLFRDISIVTNHAILRALLLFENTEENERSELELATSVLHKVRALCVLIFQHTLVKKIILISYVQVQLKNKIVFFVPCFVKEFKFLIRNKMIFSLRFLTVDNVNKCGQICFKTSGEPRRLM